MNSRLISFVIIRFAAVSLLCVMPLLAEAMNIAVVGLGNDMAIVSIDGKRRVLRDGQTSPEGVTLIRANSQSAILEIDGEQLEYTVSHDTANDNFGEKSPPYSPKQAVTIDPDRGGMYRISGTINDHSVNFLVDTGATSISIHGQLAEEMELDFRKFGKPVNIRTAGGIVKGYSVTLDEVTIDDTITLHEVTAVVIDDNSPNRIVLLGMSALSRLHITHEGYAMQLEYKQ